MRTKILLGGLAAAALFAGHASAGTVLFDNFNGETPPPDQLNWAGDATFNVGALPNSVDLIGLGGSFDLLPGNGGYIDLDGTSGNANDPAGVLTSNLTFGAGTYLLTFDLAGNQRGAVDQTTTVSFGGDFTQTLSKSSSDGFSTNSFTFTTTGGKLTFTENGPSNQQGNLLDNVSLIAVPEPATWAMMLMGFGGLGALLRNRRKLAVA